MKNLKSFIVILVLLIAGSGMSFASSVIITAAEFMEMLKADKSIVIIDADKESNYKVTHAKGAVNIWHQKLYQEGPIEGLIKNPGELASIFAGKGVSNTSRIVIYDDGSNKYSGRLYWILRYLGAENVMILHKDMEEWKKARILLTAEVPAVKAATFMVNLKPEFIVDIAYIKSNIGNAEVVLIDNRKPEEFNGTSEKPVSKGHLPGSININHEELLTAKGAYKSKEELATIAAKYGLTPEKELIFYCITSVRAGISFVVFHEILGYPKVRVYEGAYNEWIADESNKIEK